MRLIDADELAPLVKRLIEMAPTVDTPKELICSVTVDTDEIIERIKERGWEPVKHGRWIPLNDQTAKCSLCGTMESTYGKDKTGQALIHKAVKKYCPNCGAKMDEEADHDDHL